jgi:eukaryotic-like serine/threonine-protein kinase
MDPERWRRAFDVFKASIGEDADARADFVAAARGADALLRQAVDALVRADDSAGRFLEVPAAIRFLPGPDPAAERGARSRPQGEFTGTDRFTVMRELGSGGMGIVYAVHDRLRDQTVALKTLLHADPAAIHYLKQEFRGLADVAHPNLVSLYELVIEPPRCFFTMELVNGVNLVDDLRRSPGSVSWRLDRLRFVFRQLADGLCELHRSGKLHRDIKPSNVLVTPEGRVVILDFGLIADVTTDSDGGAAAPAGTPAYISPEHVSGLAATEASDWYGVGITLYEALAGRVTFEGPFDEQLRRKSETDPPSPSQIAGNVPDDLSAICMDLIARQPERRLRGRDALCDLVRAGRPGT